MSVDMGQSTREQLKSTLTRVERLEEDKKAVLEDIKAVYDEAKAFGFDTTVLRQVSVFAKWIAINAKNKKRFLICISRHWVRVKITKWADGQKQGKS